MAYKSYPIVKTETRYERLLATQKRRVTISIEYHISEDTYFLVVALPKGGSDNIIISKTQAESLVETFKINLITAR